MQKGRFSSSLKDKSRFTVVAELVGSPGFGFGPIKSFLSSYKEKGAESIPEGFDFAGITSPQNPGGVANLEPADVLNYALMNDLLDDLDFVPHISCKDQNDDRITSALVGYKSEGVESVLALTGDKPAEAKGVFELEAVGLCNKIRRMNQDYYLKAKPDKLDDVHQFFIGAAVSQYKYVEPSQMQQYYKMEKKVRAGAQFLITQVGWDWKKALELMRYMKEANIDVPVLGNVYMLSTITPAPRLMHDIKLPGCFVSDELFDKVKGESVDDHIERTAEQIAMFKAMGYAGADIGGVHDFEMFTRILNRAAEIGQQWEQYKDNLYWPAKEAWYLYDDQGNRVALSSPKKTMKHKFFNFMHWSILDPEHPGFHCFKSVMKALGTEKEKGFFYKTFNAKEKFFKYLMFDCQECGDCFLPENFSHCTIGGCEKGMDNVPCGDATADGLCGNNLERICIGEYVYNAAAAEKGGREKWRKTICPPRNPALEHKPSILNYLFGKDHTKKPPIIWIGESVHGSIPKTGKVMKILQDAGPDAYTKESGALNYIRALIESQADEGAHYIAINVDDFGSENMQVAADMMVEYVRLVRKWGKGVPACIDSSDDEVLKAGLREWYKTGEKVGKPLINSIKVHTIDEIMPLKKEFDFSFVGLLVGEGQSKVQSSAADTGNTQVDNMFNMAKTIFEAAKKYGFKADEVFFDTTVFPLAIDMPMEPGAASFTYNAFETIRRIKSDPEMKDVHCSLGVSNSVRDLPGRKIGVCRAYVAKAIEAGMDAAIVNTAHQYGMKPVDPELYKLVDAFAKMDGDPEKMTEAMGLMGKFCGENRRAKV